jgi:hypothetical protein
MRRLEKEDYLATNNNLKRKGTRGKRGEKKNKIK